MKKILGINMSKLSEFIKQRKWHVAVAGVLVIALTATLILTVNVASGGVLMLEEPPSSETPDCETGGDEMSETEKPTATPNGETDNSETPGTANPITAPPTATLTPTRVPTKTLRPGTIPSFPIAGRNSLITGTSISFDVGVEINLGGSNVFLITIADSLSQLKTIYTNDDSGYNYIDSYTEEFFNDRAIIVLFVPENSGSFRHNIGLVRNDTVLGVNIQRYIPGEDEGGDIFVTDDMASWRILIEVDYTDITGITSIEYFHHG